MTCVLCDLFNDEKTVPIYEDVLCFFIIGATRRVPMGVYKVHGMPINEKIKAHLVKKARELFGENIVIIDPMRSVKYHYHLHVYGVNQ